MASGPNRSWTRRIAGTTSSTSPCVDAALNPHRQVQQARQARGGRAPRVNRGVLPDLERSKVESERLDLPAEVLDLAPRGPRQPDGHERLLELDDLRDELGRRSRTRQPRPAALA